MRSDDVAKARAERARRVAKGEAIVEAADRQRAARRNIAAQGSLTFRSASAAVAWWGEASGRMRGPQAMHPRTETARDGSQVHVSVDGGKGGDLAEVHATLATISTALGALEHVPEAGEAYGGTATGITGRVLERWLQHAPKSRKGRPPSVPRAVYAAILVAHIVEGQTLEQLAKAHGVALSTMSVTIGKAERLLEELMPGVVVRVECGG